MQETRTTSADALLGMLSMCPMTGYELRQMISGSIGNFWNESFGQIYPTLKRLEEEGFVRGSEGERAGSRVFSLTDTGRERLMQWLGVMPRPQVKRNELLLKIFFGKLSSPETMQQQVAEWRRAWRMDLARYQAIERDIQRVHAGNPGLPFWLMTVRYGMAEVRALATWADETIEALNGMRNDQPELQEAVR
jgi:DNA-binding PadR family transcriptional regulator